MPPSDEWSNEKTLTFISLLAGESAIWDPKDKQHKLKHKVYDAWARIGEGMNIPIEQLKAKKKSLMACFRPLVNKKKSSLQSASSADEVYQPTWFAYDAMEQFLGDIYDVNKTVTIDVDLIIPAADEWSNEKTLKFINLLAAEPAIWDPRNKQYKLKYKVHEAWARIGKAMNIPVEQLKTKKKSLMASFRPLINKKKTSLRSKSSADEIYQPIWFAYDAMETFLGPIYYDEKKTINTEDDADEWSNEKTLQFIEILAAEPAIWDPRNKQHQVRHKVHDAWVRIEEAMNVPIEQLKMKKKSLMASFRPLAHKKKTSLQSASAADDVYQPTWFAYDAMEQFLGPIYDIQKSVFTDVDSENEKTQDEDTDNESTRSKNATTSGLKKRRLNFNVDDAEKNLNNGFQILNSILSNKNQEEDDCDIYAKLLATKLRKYPDEMRQRVMYKIDGLLLENPFPSSSSHWATTYSSSHSSTPSPTYIIPGSPAYTSPDNTIPQSPNSSSPRSPITISIPEDSACEQNSEYLCNLVKNVAGTSEPQNKTNSPSQKIKSKSTHDSESSPEAKVFAKRKQFVYQGKTVSVLNIRKKSVQLSKDDLSPSIINHNIISESCMPGRSRHK